MLNTLAKKILEIDDVKKIVPDLTKIKIIPENLAKQLETVIFDSEGTTLHILTTNKYSEQLKNLYTSLAKQNFGYELYYTSPEAITIALQWYQAQQTLEAQEQQAAKAQQNAQGLNAISMIKSLFGKKGTMEPGEFIMEVVRLSFQSGASDLHFQPEAGGVFLRLRIDGVLQTVQSISHKEFQVYIQKLKFISGAKMNIDYIPQDGRFSFQVDIQGIQKNIDVRVNFMPGVQTESTVMRFLDSTKSIQTFENIGFWGKMYDSLRNAIQQNYGMILITGPTGSGKTTTLYSILDYLNDGKKKLITLEDPIEYKLQGVQQSQINYAKDYTYAKGLKACLRHDPDIILVGETRTLETAEITLSASLTGHLVFSTLHTNSAIEAITRMINMGIKGYMLAPALLMIQGQRLVRKVCPHCVTTKKATDTQAAEIQKRLEKINEVRPELGLTFDGKIPHTQGCEQCNHTGFKGRVAAIEVLDISEKIKEIIIQGASSAEIMIAARQQGFLTLQEDGYIKMLKGLTTLEELRRTL